MSETQVVQPRVSPARSARVFAAHFIEVIAAMLVGMVVFGAVVPMLFEAIGLSTPDNAGLHGLLMTGYMVAGMAAWMRYRRHSWERIAELAAAIALPLVVLIGPFLAGWISASVLMTGMHVLMVPFVLAAMLLRRDEYSQRTVAGEPRSERL